MANYFLSEEAKIDMKNIYRYGCERFGELQAEVYFKGLVACFDEIAKNPYSISECQKLAPTIIVVFTSQKVSISDNVIIESRLWQLSGDRTCQPGYRLSKVKFNA